MMMMTGQKQFWMNSNGRWGGTRADVLDDGWIADLFSATCRAVALRSAIHCISRVGASTTVRLGIRAIHYTLTTTQRDVYHSILLPTSLQILNLSSLIVLTRSLCSL